MSVRFLSQYFNSCSFQTQNWLASNASIFFEAKIINRKESGNFRCIRNAWSLKGTICEILGIENELLILLRNRKLSNSGKTIWYFLEARSFCFKIFTHNGHQVNAVCTSSKWKGFYPNPSGRRNRISTWHRASGKPHACECSDEHCM